MCPTDNFHWVFKYALYANTLFLIVYISFRKLIKYELKLKKKKETTNHKKGVCLLMYTRY